MKARHSQATVLFTVGLLATVLLGVPAWSQIPHSSQIPYSKTWIFTASDLSKMAATLKSAPRVGPGNVQRGTFKSFDFPGGVIQTQVFSINSLGQIVGSYFDANFINHGFLLSEGRFTSIDAPGAVGFTNADGINDQGQIVGAYVDASGAAHGYLLSHGVFSAIDFPGGIQTIPTAINSAGEIVGVYFDINGALHGFSLRGGVFTTLDFPGADFTQPFNINSRGDIVGTYADGDGLHAFLLHQGSFASFDPPETESGPACGGTSGTQVGGINPAGDIVGFYCGPDGLTNHGFLLSNGRFSTIDLPGTVIPLLHDINSKGEIVGDYIDAVGAVHGFLLTPPPPTTATPPPATILVPQNFSTIQLAVDSAHPGDTIQVGAGNWCGALIPIPLNLVGEAGATIIGCPPGPAGTGPVGDLFKIGFLVSFTAPGTSIRGFVFDGAGFSDTNRSPLAYGIESLANEVIVKSNTFLGTGFGVSLSGTNCRVTDNVFNGFTVLLSDGFGGAAILALGGRATGNVLSDHLKTGHA